MKQRDFGWHTWTRLLLLALCLILLLTGCGVAKRVQEKPITDNSESLAKVDLITLLDPESKAEQPAAGDRSLEAAFNAFYKYTPEPPVADAEPPVADASNTTKPPVADAMNTNSLKRRRNSVQDRLIAASNFECGQYKSRLLDVQSGTNFGLSTLSTGLGTAGAIVTGGIASQVLSGAAAFFNATRSAFNENYFRQLAMEAITRAIEGRRVEFIASIVERRNLSIDQYTVEYAVGDALQYHNLCTLIAGLEFASDAVGFAIDPPIRRTMKQLSDSGFEGELKLDPAKATTLQGATTLGLRGVSRLPDAQAVVKSDEPVPVTERVVGAETETEKSLTVADARRLQLKLCFKGDAVDANLGPNTRTAIGQFQDLDKITGREGVERTFLDEVTYAEIDMLKVCSEEYLSYFEKITYPAGSESRKDLMIELEVDQSKKLNDPEVRDAIKKKQDENKMPKTGIINEELHIKLLGAAAAG